MQASGLTCGGWGDNVKHFFQTLEDIPGRKIAERFEKINDSDTAIFRVAQGKFSYYENTYYLKAATVKRQLESKKLQQNSTYNKDRSLHIMENCVINMPISLGLQKNSPLKTQINKYIRRIIEAGFIKKWIDNVMQKTYNTEIFTESTQEIKALMNLKKLYGALLVLFIGCFISIIILFIEIIYWNKTVKHHPYYNKYTKQIFLSKSK